ncbi:MAG: hypothetical protein JW750_01520 [Anaerolineaceae bacterium]|nr:hypothetical protein [Anaerolineaceae bacterium]
MNPNEIITLAESLFPRLTEAVPRYLLARDVLSQQFSPAALVDLKREIHSTRMVKILRDEQWADGSWGRLHTQDTKRKQKVSTTEVGVRRALALGLDCTDEILINAKKYLLGVLQDRITYRDFREKHVFFDRGLHLICAACVAQIEPDHAALNETKTYAVEVLARAFADGNYNARSELSARYELDHLPADRVLPWTRWLNTRHDYTLLSTCRLPVDLRTRYLEHIWNLPDGLGYVGASFQIPPANSSAEVFNRWLNGLDIFSRMPGSERFLAPLAEWLWEQKDAGGCWDFGKPISRGPNHDVFPYSDHWRGENRSLDWSTRVLRLLSRIWL